MIFGLVNAAWESAMTPSACFRGSGSNIKQKEDGRVLVLVLEQLVAVCRSGQFDMAAGKDSGIIYC